MARALGCSMSELTGSESPVPAALQNRSQSPEHPVESPMVRLPDVFDWWIERMKELRGRGVLPQDIQRVEATVQAIDAVRMRSSGTPTDLRTAPDVIREWERLLPYVVDATKPASRLSEVAGG